MTVEEDGQGGRSVYRVQSRIVIALIRREMRAHFGESRMGYLWALASPSLHVVVLLVLFTYVLRRHIELGTSLPLFMMTGVIPYFLYSKSVALISSSINGNRALLALPPIKPHDVVLARTILESSTYMFIGIVMFFALFVAGIPEAMPADPLPVMEACAFSTALAAGIGMINIVMVSFFHNWMTFFMFFTSPLWFFSGLWYLPETIAEPYRGYILYNPLVHVVLLFRVGFYPDYRASLLDEGYLLFFTTIALALGLAGMRVARRQLLSPL